MREQVQDTLRSVFNSDDVDFCVSCNTIGVADDFVKDSLDMFLGIFMTWNTVLVVTDADHVVGD